MSETPITNLIPTGEYYIRDGLVPGEDNYVSAVRNQDDGKIELHVKAKDKGSVWVVSATGEDDDKYMIYPNSCSGYAVAVLEPTDKPLERALGAVLDVDNDQWTWVLTQGGRGQYVISNYSYGIRMSWTWSGNPEEPMTASPSNRLYIIEKVGE